MHRRRSSPARFSRDATPTCDTSAFRWMLNGSNKSPCDLAQEVLRMCKPGLQLETLPRTLSCDASDDSCNCCCSTATYALLSACWVCGGNNIDDIEGSYGSFFRDSHCEEPSINLTLPSGLRQQQVDQLSLPQWSLLRPRNLISRWNITAAEIYSTSLFSSVSPILYFSNSSMAPSSSNSGTATFTSASIAAAVLGTLAGVVVVGIMGWFLLRWHRRRALSPKSGPRVDLTAPGVEEKGPRCGVDLLSGEQDNPPRSPTFPFPFEWFFRRYHPDAPHSIEPRSDYGEVVASRTRQIAAQGSTPPNKRHGTVDQLDRDLARLSGMVACDTSVKKPRPPKVKRLPRLSISRRDGSGSQNSSGSINSDNRRARHHSRKSKGKYHHLPPSAQYLADVARYPQNVDPDRPWAKPPS